MNALLRMLARRTAFVEGEILGLETLVQTGHVCIDVGAEYGLYTHALMGLVGPAGTVHSIEPLPGAYRILRAGLALTGRRNVRTYRLALGDHAEQGALSVPRRWGLPVHGRAFLTSGAKGEGPNVEFTVSRTVPVEVITLDELCARERIGRVDFVKADVEGAELTVLQGAEATLAAYHPTLLLEIEQRHLDKYACNAAEIVHWLTDRGYTTRVWRRGAWQAVDEVNAASRNYLFVPR